MQCYSEKYFSQVDMLPQWCQVYKCGALVYTNVGPWSIQMWALGPYKCGPLVYTNVGP